jgi:hypothetical protein
VTSCWLSGGLLLPAADGGIEVAAGRLSGYSGFPAWRRGGGRRALHGQTVGFTESVSQDQKWLKHIITCHWLPLNPDNEKGNI